MLEDDALTMTRRPAGYTGRRRARNSHRSGQPAEVVLTVATVAYAGLLWLDPASVLQIRDLDAGQRRLLLVAVLPVATALAVTQTASMFGLLRRIRPLVLAVGTAWWVYTAVDSLLADWHDPRWLPELVLAWLASYCTLAVARSEARAPVRVIEGP